MKQLAKIIPLLSSDQPGEVAAAASAIGRVLAQNGKDWHWLAQVLSGGSYQPFADGSPALKLVIQIRGLEVANGLLTALNANLRAEARKAQDGVSSLRRELARSRQMCATLQIETSRLRRIAELLHKPANPKPDPSVSLPHATVYSDGGCDARTGIGAWACIVRYGDAEEGRRTIAPR